MSDRTPFRLKHPIERRLRPAGGEERVERTEELQLRRLKGKDLRSIPAGATDAQIMLHMIGRTADLDADQVDQLDLEDIAALGEVIEDFIPDGLLTGKTSSET